MTKIMNRVWRQSTFCVIASVRKAAVFLPLFLSVFSFDATAVSDSQDWRWSVTPYAWVISTDLETTLDLPESGKQRFSPVSEKIDFAAQFRIEAHKGRFGVLFDYTNLQLSDSVRKDPLVLNTDSKTQLIEAAGTWALTEDTESPNELFLGTRVLMVDLELELLGESILGLQRVRQLDATLTDLMFGIRTQRQINDNWSWLWRGDVATGDTNMSFNTSLILARDVGESGRVMFGYRYLLVDFKQGNDLIDPKMTVNGPMIGYQFDF